MVSLMTIEAVRRAGVVRWGSFFMVLVAGLAAPLSAAETDLADDVCQLQTGVTTGFRHLADLGSDEGQAVGGSTVRLATKGGSCAPLRDEGSFFTAPVYVGTPEQRFDIVADTGSNALIVPSCICTDKGFCNKRMPCFGETSTVPSTSFAGLSDDYVYLMMYGSGAIEVVLGSDNVRVGDTRAVMKDGLFLMVGRQLTFSIGPFEATPFQGILGLGKPQNWEALGPNELAEPGFAEKAGLQRFAVCFQEGKGTLSLDPPPPQHPLPAVSDFHWALGLQGVSVGKGRSLPICHRFSKYAGFESNCGAIVDSGTTLMLGPQAHVLMLLEAICEGWPRCMDHVTQSPGTQKTKALSNLLYNCGDWLNEGAGLAELPDVNFDLHGKKRSVHQKVKLSPQNYITEVDAEEFEVVIKKLGGVLPMPTLKPTGIMTKTCSPAFSSMAEEATRENGPLWIFGGPMFFQYNIVYTVDVKNPTLAFTEGCEPCGGDSVEMLQTNATSAERDAQLRRKWPRRLTGPLRWPTTFGRMKANATRVFRIPRKQHA